MDVDDANVIYAETILDETHHEVTETTFKDTTNLNDSLINTQEINQEAKLNTNDNNIDKHCAVWTTSATLILLKLYEARMEMLETPKKKTGMWLAISEDLKKSNIEMTPDQVRWKINALTKKYKQSIESGQQKSFKYFEEMDKIFGQYNDDDTYRITELLQRKNVKKHHLTTANHLATLPLKSGPESKALIELRKIRLANRIESDRSQSKIKLEKQWLEYVRRQEDHKQLRDLIYERHLKLREEELELRKKELEIKESLELRKMQLREKEQEEILRIEKEKCDVITKILTYRKTLN